MLGKVQQNADGKLRIIAEDGTATPFLATVEQLHADSEWRARVELRPSEFKEGTFFAVLMQSPYVDIAV